MNDLLSIVVDDPNEPDDWRPPAYGTPGWVLVEILGPCATNVYRYEIEEAQVDPQASTYWIEEGVGIQWWIDTFAPDDLQPGWYVFEDVVGTYHHGAGWVNPSYCDEDDEEWEFGAVRPATPEEIDTLTVIKKDEG